MKYITRPAPPPPGALQQSNNISTTSSSQMAKPKPPRPPPPRAVPTQQQQTDSKSSKIFSNLFGKKPKTSHMEVKLPPPRLPPPAAALANRHATIPQAPAPVHRSDVQLINFEASPPSSPMGFIKKSNTGGSDSLSIDSFCSTNSSPHNFNSGTQSQAERYKKHKLYLMTSLIFSISSIITVALRMTLIPCQTLNFRRVPYHDRRHSQTIPLIFSITFHRQQLRWQCQHRRLRTL